MTVGLALRANPQAPFERTSTSYHQNFVAWEKPNRSENAETRLTCSTSGLFA